MEGTIDGRAEVPGGDAPGHGIRQPLVRLGHDEDATGDLQGVGVAPGFGGGALRDGDSFGDVLRGEPVQDHAVAGAPGQRQHLLAQGGDEDRRRSPEAARKAKAPHPQCFVSHLFAGEERAQGGNGLARAFQGALELDAVPVLDDRGRTRADAEAKPARSGFGAGGDFLREQSGAAGEHVGDGRAQAEAL